MHSIENEMNGVLGHVSALERLYLAGDTWANEMNFVMNHEPGAGSIHTLCYYEVIIIFCLKS